MNTPFHLSIICFALVLCSNWGCSPAGPSLMSSNLSTSQGDDFAQRKALTLNANVVLLYRNDGSGNFDLTNKEQRDLLNDYLERINFIYSNFQPPKDSENCYTGTDFIPDAKIRFDFNIVEVRNTYFWNYLNSGADLKVKNYNNLTPHANWYMKTLDDSIHFRTKLPAAINIYFTMDGAIFNEMMRSRGGSHKEVMGGQAAAQYPDLRNFQRSSMVHMPNVFLKYQIHRYQSPTDYNTTWQETRNWNLGDARGLAHELGHTFGLAHSNEHYRANQCSYSLMSQAGSHERNWLPPSEIRKIHHNLSMTNLLQFVDKNSWYENTQVLAENDHWNTKRRYYSSFHINPGVTIEITDTVILPSQSKIYLDRNARLHLTKNGVLMAADGKKFTRIEMHNTAQTSGL